MSTNHPFSPSTFEDMLDKVESLGVFTKREDTAQGFRCWYGDLEGVCANGPQNAVAYCVDYTHTGQAYRIQLVGTGWHWEKDNV